MTPPRKRPGARPSPAPASTGAEPVEAIEVAFPRVSAETVVTGSRRRTLSRARAARLETTRAERRADAPADAHPEPVAHAAVD